MLFAVAAVFAACSDDEQKWNTTDAKVAMANEAISLKESKGLFNVPIAVTGERNANIQVTVEVKETGANGAKEDVHYMVTTKTLNISPDQEVGNIEIKTVDDTEINDPRTFSVTIVSAKGAKIEGNATTEITLKDNDAEFYDKLAGKWKMKSVNSKGAEQSWDVTVYVGEEGDADYNKYVYVTGMVGYDWTVATLEYDFNKETQQVSLKFVLGLSDVMPFAEDVNFGLGGLNDVYLMSVVGNQFRDDVEIIGIASADMKNIEFNTEYPIYGAITDKNANLLGYTWFSASNITMSR